MADTVQGRSVGPFSVSDSCVSLEQCTILCET